MKSTLQRGQVVRLDPCMDLFMRGVIYAEIVSIGSKWIRLRWTINPTVTARVPVSCAYLLTPA